MNKFLLCNRVVLPIFLLMMIFSYAQNNKIYHESITSRDGLEIDIVRSMEFDNDGFLWLGGESLAVRTIINSTKKNRLQRYNGNTFHTIDFPAEYERIRKVNHFFKRSDGKFYIHTNEAINFLFDPVTTKFTKISFTGFNKKVTGSSLVFAYKGNNYLLLQSDREIYMCVLKDDLSVEILYSFNSDVTNYLVGPKTAIIPFRDFCLISDTSFPIHYIDWNGRVLKKFSGEKFIKKIGNTYEKYFIDSYFKNNDQHYVFLGNNPTLHYVDSIAMEVRPAPFRNNRLLHQNLSNFVDKFDNEMILTATNEDLEIATIENNTINSKTYAGVFSKSSPMRIASKNCTEEVWVGTGTGELHYFKFPSTTVQTFLKDHSIRTIFRKQKNTYLIATETKGWFEFDTKSKTVKPYTILRDRENFKPASARNIFSIKDKLWSNSSGRIIEIDTITRATNLYRYYPVISLEKLNDSILIYGTHNFNVVKFNTHTKRHTPFISSDSLNVYDLAIHKNKLVGATDKGILKYDFKSKQTRFINDSTTLFKDPFFLMVDYNEDHGFMLGSRTGNIITHNFDTESFELFYEDSFKAGIATILPTSTSWWINTFNGFVSYNPETKEAQRFSVEDGFSDNESNRYSAINTEDGMLVGTLNGLNYFNGQALQRDISETSLVLLKRKSYNTKLDKIETVYDRTLLAKNTTITLPAEFKDLEVEFSLTDMVTKNENSYYYKLNNASWISLNKRPQIRFQNLAPGTYTLTIEARDFSERVVGKPLQLKIISNNFFYKTWWFICLVVLGLILFTAYLIKQTRLRIKLQEHFSEGLLDSQEEERTRIAKELHDSLGQQLTLIKKTAQKNQQEDISTLSNLALEEVRSISRGLYPSVLKQLGLTESIEQLVYDIDEQTNLNFYTEIADIDSYFSEKETLSYYRFIQESLHNIVKHAEASSVSIFITKSNRMLTTLIKDNGKGFEVSEKIKQNSLGLKTMTERIRILNGTLAIDSKLGKGTVLLAEISIKK
ncbi:histidine kinase [Jejudonia soesokkakensis]|uniref:Histidine kinase n=1 Tax=Jejudonia soesokkakensis TaxID=1323432 RepID=A0ABW2MXS9_9FLAO